MEGFLVTMPDSTADVVPELDPAALDAAVAAAEQAFAAAPDLAALAAVRPAHLGDRAPLQLARRGLGSLPGPDRAEAGKRVNAARQQVQQAFDARRAELAAERDERVLVEEAVDVTLPWDRVPRGSPAPAHPARPSGSPTCSWPWAGRWPRDPRSSRPG